MSILRGFFNRLRLGSGSSGAPSMAFKEEPGLGFYRKAAGVIGVGGGEIDATAHPLDDATAIVKGSGDATKLVRVEADGLTTGTTRVITMADENIDLTPGTGSFASEAEGTLAASAMQDLIDDTTPQLGGNLDANGKTIDGRTVATDGTKLDGIESNATADQTGAEIKTAYEGEPDTNAFTDAEQTKLSGIEASADVTDATNVDAAGAIMESDISGTVVGTTDTQTLTNKTLTSPTLNTGVSGTAFLDEDDMTSDSASKLASQQSIKAYVDAQVSGADPVVATTVAGATPTAERLYNDNTVKGWLSWTDSGGTSLTLEDDFNCSSVTDNGTGNLTFVFATAMADSTYGVVATVENATGVHTCRWTSRTTGQVQIIINNTTWSAADGDGCCIVVGEN